MNRRTLFIMLLIVPLFVWISGGTVFAMHTGFSTKEMDASMQKTFLSNINLTRMTEEPPQNTILCFDVNEHERIAIGTKDSQNKYVSVYDERGEFQYGYRFVCNQSFGIQWDGDNFIIYFVRSDVAALFDLDGNAIELRLIEDTPENSSYWDHTVFANEKRVHQNRYLLKNNMGLFGAFSFSYSQLLKLEPSGNGTLLYDVSERQTTQTIVGLIVIALFVIFVLTVVLRQLFKAKNMLLDF